jgi:hypothetical protein
MYKKQGLPTNLEKFYSCGEGTWLQISDAERRLPIQMMDVVIEKENNHALWKNDAMRGADNNEIGINIPVGYPRVDKKTDNEPNRALPTLKTEAQVLSDELLANDSLGG